MMCKILLLSVTICLGVLASIFFIQNEAISGELLSISVKHLSLNKNERIVGFEIIITSGEIVSLPHVPVGWNVNINNDPSLNTRIRGIGIVGAVAFEDSKFFKDFIIIEKAGRKEPAFNIEGEIIITIDFENEKRLSFKLDDLILRELKRGGGNF